MGILLYSTKILGLISKYINVVLGKKKNIIMHHMLRLISVNQLCPFMEFPSAVPIWNNILNLGMDPEI